MSEFDIGKTAKLKRSLMIGLDQGDMVVIAESNSDSKKTYVHFGYHLNKSDLVLVDDSKPDYETSNRKKLHDHIKASGYTSSEPGEVLGNKWHFSNITKKSRFDKFGDISEKSLSDSEFLVNSIITGLNKKSDNVETEIDSEFQFGGGGYDPVFDMPESKNTTSETQYHVTNNYASKYSSFIKLQKLAFAICFIIVILLISILYFVVSK